MNDTHVTTGRWKLGLFLSITAALMWGLLPTLLKILVANIDAVAITWYRLVLAFAILFVFLAIKRQLPNFRQLNVRYLTLLMVVCVGLCVNYITYIWGIQIVGPGPAQVIIQTNVVLVILGGVFIYGEGFTKIQTLGLMGIITGLVMFCNYPATPT